jgi:hypothetical protein
MPLPYAYFLICLIFPYRYISGISPFIGTMLALVTAGPLADRSARFLSKRNQGMFEAEMRLVLVLPCAICFAIGTFVCLVC